VRRSGCNDVAVDEDVPIPRDGKLDGWKLPTGVQKAGSRDAPDACPFCGTKVAPTPGARLGQGSWGENVNPEPWQEIADCPKCRASLHRLADDPWIGSAP
jgi:hypothetical protein